MKSPNRETVSNLDSLPNIGKAIMADLHIIGINNPKDLVNKDAFSLYKKLCDATGKKHDPCVIDVFMSAIDFMQGGEAKPWWTFTEKRKHLSLAKLIT